MKVICFLRIAPKHKLCNICRLQPAAKLRSSPGLGFKSRKQKILGQRKQSPSALNVVGSSVTASACKHQAELLWNFRQKATALT